MDYLDPICHIGMESPRLVTDDSENNLAVGPVMILDPLVLLLFLDCIGDLYGCCSSGKLQSWYAYRLSSRHSSFTHDEGSVYLTVLVIQS
jgi:hypothetical protein